MPRTSLASRPRVGARRLECQNRAQRNWRAKNPGITAAYALKSYYMNREKRLFSQAKTRAKRSELEFNIELSDIAIPEYCPALGLKLSTQPAGRKWGSANSPSIDRIDPNKGYVKGNIQVISWRANSLKKNATADELCQLAAFMLRREG